MHPKIEKFVLYLESQVSYVDDKKEERTRKATLVLISSLICVAGALWSAMYFFLGFHSPAIIAVVSTTLIGLVLIVFLRTKKYSFFITVQLLLILFLPILLQWSLGGYENSGCVLIWSFLSPLGAIIFLGLKKSYPWLAAFILLLAASSLSNNYWEGLSSTPLEWHRLLFFTMNIGAVSFVFFMVLWYFLSQLDRQNITLAEKKNQLESLSQKLAKYLSPQVYASIFSGKQDVTIKTYRRRLTVFFSDIVGFTNITDTLESESLTELLNDYLNEMANITLKYGGTIDKFMGDSIMIFFGDPETQGVNEDALACVSMAIEMRERMKYLRKKWKAQGINKPLHIRIGINSGYCTVGNFGSDDRIDYTIIGGQVNLASRLESKAVPNQILISEETYLLINENIRCIKKDDIKVRGISHPIQTFQVEDIKEQVNVSPNSLFQTHGEGYSITLDLPKISKAEKLHLSTVLQQAIEGISNEDQAL